MAILPTFSRESEVDKDVSAEEMRRQEREQQRVRDLAGKVGTQQAGEVDEEHVRDLEDQMADREVQQRGALDAMRGQGAAHRDGRVTPDVPDHLNNPDATVDDHIKDLERRANTAEAADEDLRRAARGERDAAAHSEPGSRPSDPGAAQDAADALHGSASPTMPTDPANAQLDPQVSVDPSKAPQPKHPEAAYGAPTSERDKNATASAKEREAAQRAKDKNAKKD